MKVRFQADANLKRTIVLATTRREPAMDFLSALQAGLAGLPDRDRPKEDDPIRHYLQPVPLGRKGEESKDWFILLNEALYDRDLLGLTGTPDDAWIA